MNGPEKANDPGAGNTEAVQDALVEGADVHDNVQIALLPVGCADGDDPGRRFGWPVVRLDGADPHQSLSFADLLEALDLTEDEFVAVCYKPVDGSFATQVVLSGHAAGAVASVQTRSCVWFTPNPTAGPERRNQGRGREREVTRFLALYADLDVKPGAFDDIAQAWKFIAVLSAIVVTRPSAVIYSGHGLQPIWPVEDGHLSDEVRWAWGYRLIRQFGRLCTSAARSFCGANLDNVFNMDRLLQLSPRWTRCVTGMRERGRPTRFRCWSVPGADAASKRDRTPSATMPVGGYWCGAVTLTGYARSPASSPTYGVRVCRLSWWMRRCSVSPLPW